MGWVFGRFFGEKIVNAGEDKGENETASDIGRPVLAAGDTADGGKDDKDKHDDVHGDAEGFLPYIMREGEGDDKEDGGDDHGVGRGEGRLAGAIWTGA